eukprot:COSAG05_NODE_991_length_6277_cov_77.221305_2_plen_160_part_00
MVNKNDTLLIVTNNSDSDSENRVTVLSATPVASATAAVLPLSCRVAPAAPPPDHLMRSLSWPPLCANEQHTSSIPPSTCFNLVTHGTHPYVYSVGGGLCVSARACAGVCACVCADPIGSTTRIMRDSVSERAIGASPRSAKTGRTTFQISSNILGAFNT